jgi:hypothetical protein
MSMNKQRLVGEGVKKHFLAVGRVEVRGRSGVEHVIEMFPVQFSKGEDLEKDIIKLRLRCVDLEIPLGILVVPKRVKIDREVLELAKGAKIILVKKLNEIT